MLHRSKYAKGAGGGGEESPNPALACPLLKTQVRIIKSPHAAAGLECFQKVTLYLESLSPPSYWKRLQAQRSE